MLKLHYSFALKRPYYMFGPFVMCVPHLTAIMLGLGPLQVGVVLKGYELFTRGPI